MKENPEYQSRFLANRPPKPIRWTEEYKQSAWEPIVRSLVRTSIYAAHKGYDPALQEKPKLIRKPHVAHYNDFQAWMNIEGYTYSWQDVWREWRALGAHYKTVPPEDEAIVQAVIRKYRLTFRPRQPDDPDFFTQVSRSIGYAAEHTYLDHYEKDGKFSGETLATIHEMDWTLQEGHRYEFMDRYSLWNYLSIELQ